MTSRLESAASASVTRGSHSGKIGKKDVAAAPATPERKPRRESSLYSRQPQSGWSWSLISSPPSVPLEAGRAEREPERLAHARRVDRARLEVRSDPVRQVGRHLAGEHLLADGRGD